MSNKTEIKNCDQMASSLLSVNDARQRILESVTVVAGHEKIAIRASLNRILDSDILSPINVPSYDNSAMDGYAINSADIPSSGQVVLNLAGKSFAGQPYNKKMLPGQTIRIMTGAMMPEGADSVVMQEHAQVDGDNITITSSHCKGENVRYIGEDMKDGEIILQPGKKITPAELGLLSSLGIAEVKVKRKLRVAFFSTGDELRSVGEPLKQGQIYDSNRYTLYGMLQRLNVELIDMGVIADNRDDIRQAFTDAASIADAVITSGGVSVGEADFVKDTLEELGQVNFWRVAMKPGKPMAIGTIGNAAFFGVPGNPVSAMAVFYQFVQPALSKMMGHEAVFKLEMKLPCLTALHKAPGRLEYQRGVMSYDDKGKMVVTTSGKQGSHILTSMSRANCFIVLEADNAGVAEGGLVTVQPFTDFV